MKQRTIWEMNRISRMIATIISLTVGISGIGVLGLQDNNTKEKMNSAKMQIKKERFGTTADGKEVSLYTLSHGDVMSVKITNYGGIVTELWVPDKNGNVGDVVLGFDSLKQYIGSHPAGG